MKFKIDGYYFGSKDIKDDFNKTDLGKKLAKNIFISWIFFAVIELLTLIVLFIIDNNLEFNIKAIIFLLCTLSVALFFPLSQECTRDGAFMCFSHNFEE